MNADSGQMAMREPCKGREIKFRGKRPNLWTCF